MIREQKEFCLERFEEHLFALYSKSMLSNRTALENSKEEPSLAAP